MECNVLNIPQKERNIRNILQLEVLTKIILYKKLLLNRINKNYKIFYKI